MEEQKKIEWTDELRDEVRTLREWIEKNEKSSFANYRLIHLIPILVDAVINLEKRLSEIEKDIK